MWVIFLSSCIVVALAAMLVLWIGNKVYLSIKRQNRKYENENNESREYEEVKKDER